MIHVIIKYNKGVLNRVLKDDTIRQAERDSTAIHYVWITGNKTGFSITIIKIILPTNYRHVNLSLLCQNPDRGFTQIIIIFYQ